MLPALEGALVERVTLVLELADGDRRIVGARLLADIRLREADRDRLELIVRDALGVDRLELRELDARGRDGADRETDGLDRLNERAEARDRLDDEREELRLERRPSTWAVTVSIAIEATIGHHHQRFGWADMADLLA